MAIDLTDLPSGAADLRLGLASLSSTYSWSDALTYFRHSHSLIPSLFAVTNSSFLTSQLMYTQVLALSGL